MTLLCTLLLFGQIRSEAECRNYFSNHLIRFTKATVDEENDHGEVRLAIIEFRADGKSENQPDAFALHVGRIETNKSQTRQKMTVETVWANYRIKPVTDGIDIVCKMENSRTTEDSETERTIIYPWLEITVHLRQIMDDSCQVTITGNNSYAWKTIEWWPVRSNYTAEFKRTRS